jgi:hypothetical protein
MIETRQKMKPFTIGKSRFAAWAGIIAPALFVGVFTIEGWLRPGYDPAREFVSALSLGGRGWIQMTSFILTGALLFVFSRGVAAGFPTGKASKAGPILLAIISLLLLISGPFVMDPTGTPQGEMTVHGIIHGLAGGIVFLLMPTTCFVFLRRFRSDPEWLPSRWWTLVLAIIITAAVILLTIASKVPGIQSAFEGWMGIIQRTLLIPFMLWVFLFGLNLLKRSKQD